MEHTRGSPDVCGRCRYELDLVLDWATDWRDDLDSCRDPDSGTIAPWAQEIIRAFRSYAEVSPSKTGEKIYASGAPASVPVNSVVVPSAQPMNGKAAKVEVFVSARYFACTGQILEESTVRKPPTAPTPGNAASVAQAPRAGRRRSAATCQARQRSARHSRRRSRIMRS